MILVIAFFAPIIIAITYAAYTLGNEGHKAAFGSVFPQAYTSARGTEAIFLQNKFEYYKALSSKGRDKFFKRFGALLNSKEFIGGDGFIVTDEMRYYIIACWTQVTFGLDRFHMPDFQKIIVFESTFYSRMIERQVKGLTSNAGFIYLSWADFLTGYENPTDNYNLGIHELSHAFLLSTFHKENFDIGFSSYIDEWFEATQKEFADLSKGLPSHLREYAGANKFEFFSVCMENFFETPAPLREKMPGIYYHLCYLLNQDPLNITGDYNFQLTPNTTYGITIELPKKQARSFKYVGNNIFKLIAVIPCAFFILTLHAYFITYITFWEFLLLFLAGLSFGIVKNVREKIYRFLGPETGLLFIVTFMGFGLLDIVVGLNYYIPTSETKTESYAIVGEEYIAHGSHRSNRVTYETEFILKDNALGNFAVMRTIDGHWKLDDGKTYYLDVHYHYGLMGFKVFEWNSVTGLKKK